MGHEVEGASIGGGLVESYGIGAEGAYLPKGRKGIKKDRNVDMTPVFWYPLSFAAGTSCGAPYTDVHDPTRKRLIGGEVVPAWSPSNPRSQFNGFTVLADRLAQNVDLDDSFPYSTMLLGNYSRRL